MSFCCNQEYFQLLNNNKWSDAVAVPAAADHHHPLHWKHFFHIFTILRLFDPDRVVFMNSIEVVFYFDFFISVCPSFVKYWRKKREKENVINYFLLCVHFPAYYLAAMVKDSTLYSLKKTYINCQRHCPICFSRDIVPGLLLVRFFLLVCLFLPFCSQLLTGYWTIMTTFLDTLMVLTLHLNSPDIATGGLSFFSIETNILVCSFSFLYLRLIFYFLQIN